MKKILVTMFTTSGHVTTTVLRFWTRKRAEIAFHTLTAGYDAKAPWCVWRTFVPIVNRTGYSHGPYRTQGVLGTRVVERLYTSYTAPKHGAVE